MAILHCIYRNSPQKSCHPSPAAVPPPCRHYGRSRPPAPSVLSPPHSRPCTAAPLPLPPVPCMAHNIVTVINQSRHSCPVYRSCGAPSPTRSAVWRIAAAGGFSPSVPPRLQAPLPPRASRLRSLPPAKRSPRCPPPVSPAAAHPPEYKASHPADKTARPPVSGSSG